MKNPQTSKKVLIGTQESPEVDNEKKIKISTYFLMNGNKSASYDYDFGDGWEHEVFLEGILPAESHINYPKCTNGMRACPPENCGGVYGYEELLEIMANPNHEEYVEKKEWLGGIGALDYDGQFNPEKFEPRYFSI